MDWGLGFKVQAVGFRAWGVGLRVQGLWDFPSRVILHLGVAHN